MKKDLTYEKRCEICLKHKTCGTCPLNDNNISISACMDIISIGQKNINIFFEKEIEESILDKTEKEYLEIVIRPFKDNIKYISKKDYSNYYYIHIQCFGSMRGTLPWFSDKDEIYKGMEVNRKYTLEELGLFEEPN